MKIKVKQSGEIIGVPGLRHRVRTPLEFDVAENNLGRTVLSLIRQGINNFEVIHGSSSNDRVERRSMSREDESKLKGLQDEVSNLSNKIDYLFEYISNMETKEKIAYSDTKKEEPMGEETKSNKKPVDDEDEEGEFIPSIYLDGFEKHGDGKEKVDRKENVEEDVEDLSKNLK